MRISNDGARNADRKAACISEIPPKQTKKSRMLSILRARPAGLNRFEAEQFGDHCFHSTVAALRRDGYLILDEWEWMQTRFGDVHVKRYHFLADPASNRG